MKIYHTETQADYDALMVELESDGVIWGGTAAKPSQFNARKFYKNQTCIKLDNDIIRHSPLDYYQSEHPDIPIIKYKAKADEKMRFTKENVEAVINDYFRQAGFESCDDLIAEIHNLDDTPEKVVVPEFVADFYEECENATLEFLITQLEATYGRSELGEWYRSCRGRHRNGNANAQEVIAKMKLYGYEVEEEPLYEVIIAGRNLLKLFRGRIDHEFAEKTELCAWAKVAYQLTEQEIKAIDERYIPFMVPVDGANKD